MKKINIYSFSDEAWKKNKVFQIFLNILFFPLSIFLGAFILLGLISTRIHKFIELKIASFCCWSMYKFNVDTRENIDHFLPKTIRQLEKEKRKNEKKINKNK